MAKTLINSALSCLYIIAAIVCSISEKDFNNQALRIHNGYRKLHLASPLKLDKTLILKAQALVKTAVKKKGFGEVMAGENVYQVCATFNVSLTPKQISKAW